MKRREALKVLGAAASVPLVATLSARDAHALGVRIHEDLARRGHLALSGLTAEQRRMVAAMAEVIIPETDTPGAKAVGVDGFIDILVGEWFDDEERTTFLAGIAETDARARRAFGKLFADGTAAEQNALARTLDAESTTARRTNAPRTFFNRMKDVTVYAYFTSEKVQKDVFKHRMFFERYDGCAPV